MATAGRWAFLTGATSGIGLATAQALARRGFNLSVNARTKANLDRVAAQLEAQGAPHVARLAFDVRDRASISAAERSQPERFSNVDVLVNNAGMAREVDPIQDGNPEDWDEMIDTNVKGLLNVTRAILPHMVARGRGHIVNIGSTAGRWVYRGGAVYNATKFAVRALTEALRLDVHGTGVRVSTIDPGLVETNFSLVRFRGDAERAKKVYEKTTPLTSDDVAEAVAWVVERPARVNISEIVMFPTDQASVRDVHRRA